MTARRGEEVAKEGGRPSWRRTEEGRRGWERGETRREKKGQEPLTNYATGSQLHKPAPGYLYATRLPISGLTSTWLTTVHRRPVVSLAPSRFRVLPPSCRHHRHLLLFSLSLSSPSVIGALFFSLLRFRVAFNFSVSHALVTALTGVRSPRCRGTCRTVAFYVRAIGRARPRNAGSDSGPDFPPLDRQAATWPDNGRACTLNKSLSGRPATRTIPVSGASVGTALFFTSRCIQTAVQL